MTERRDGRGAGDGGSRSTARHGGGELTPRDEAFVRRVADVLEQGSARLDARTRSRLRRARAGALASARPRRAALPGLGWGPAATVLAASALALLTVPALLSRGPLPETGAVPSPGDADDLEIVLNVENLDMLEDLEFFEWLAAQPEVI